MLEDVCCVDGSRFFLGGRMPAPALLLSTLIPSKFLSESVIICQGCHNKEPHTEQLK